MQSVIEVDCPACGKRTPYSSANRWRPFCSERCRTIDLGAWASDQYRIGGDAREEDGLSSDGDDRAGRGVS